MNNKINFNAETMFLLNEKARYKVLYGGRGSGKTQAIAMALIILALQKKTRILCARQLQTSIADSVHKVLKDMVEQMGLDRFFIITKDSLRSVNGSEFIFKGIKNNTSEIKSMQGINYCWVEEAASVSEESWDVLIPTIREEGSEFFISFNPDWKQDATYQKFIEHPPENCICKKLNYYDNPWFPEVLRQEMEDCKKLNENRYKHIWLGEPNVEGANLIKLSKFHRYKYAPESFPFVFICCDTAFSEKKKADGSAFMLVGVIDKKVYFLDGYWKQVTFPDLRRDLLSFYKKAKSKYSNLSGVYIENKGSGISLIQQLREEGMPIMELQPTVTNKELKKEQISDKYTRFLEIEADIDSGLCYIPESADWLLEFEKQAEAFTGGKQDEHDDFIDCCIYSLKIARKGIEIDWSKAYAEFY